MMEIQGPPLDRMVDLTQVVIVVVPHVEVEGEVDDVVDETRVPLHVGGGF